MIIRMKNNPIDLNLFVIFQSLMRERKVSLAAQALGLSQPAVSHALAKLRSAFADPLFVRTRYGIKPTSRALEMAESVEHALALLAETTHPKSGFDPQTVKSILRLAMADDTQSLVLPQIASFLQCRAPQLSLEVYKLHSDTILDELESGARDLAFGSFSALPASFYRQELYKEEFICVLRGNHPKIGETLSLEQYVKQNHVLVCPIGRPTKGVVDDVLAKIGLSRRVVLYVPEFMAAPLIVERTNHILTISRRIAERMAATANVKLLKPPLELPHYAITQIWHGHRHRDPLHSWLRGQVAALDF